MRLIILIIILIIPLSVHARNEGSCFVSGLVGSGENSANYKAVEFGCEGSNSRMDWFGGYVNLLLMSHQGFKLSQDLGGLDFGARKNIKLVSFEAYRKMVPYISFGGIVQFSGEEVTEGEDEYQKIDNISFYSFSSSLGVKVPISKRLFITPKINYLLPLREKDDHILWFGIAMNVKIDI